MTRIHSLDAFCGAQRAIDPYWYFITHKSNRYVLSVFNGDPSGPEDSYKVIVRIDLWDIDSVTDMVKSLAHAVATGAINHPDEYSDAQRRAMAAVIWAVM